LSLKVKLSVNLIQGSYIAVTLGRDWLEIIYSQVIRFFLLINDIAQYFTRLCLCRHVSDQRYTVQTRVHQLAVGHRRNFYKQMWIIGLQQHVTLLDTLSQLKRILPNTGTLRLSKQNRLQSEALPSMTTRGCVLTVRLQPLCALSGLATWF